MSLYRRHNLLTVPAIGNITFVGIGSAHADTASHSTNPSVVTPPGGMLAGDLAVLVSDVLETDANPAINNAGGQTWTFLGKRQCTAGPLSESVWMCTFNGTWSANPSVNNNSVAVCRSLFLLAFRPTKPGAKWVIHGAFTKTETTLGVSPTVATVVGQAVSRSSVQVAYWHSENALTHSSLTGSGWTQAGSAQYRNMAGNDMSTSFAYNIRKEAGAAINTSKTISSTPDPGCDHSIITFADSYM